MKWTNQDNWYFQTDKPIKLKSLAIERMVNHTRCLSDELDDIYIQKPVSISHYTQLATLTNVNAQSTAWFEIFAQ